MSRSRFPSFRFSMKIRIFIFLDQGEILSPCCFCNVLFSNENRLTRRMMEAVFQTNEKVLLWRWTIWLLRFKKIVCDKRGKKWSRCLARGLGANYFGDVEFKSAYREFKTFLNKTNIIKIIRIIEQCCSTIIVHGFVILRIIACSQKYFFIN